MAGKLNSHEREVLEMVAGTREWVRWGAWVGACLEYLKGNGYITSYIGNTPALTEKGRAALEDEKA